MLEGLYLPFIFFVSGTSCHNIEMGVHLLYQKYCPEANYLSQMKTMPSEARNLQMNEVNMPWESVMTVDEMPWRCLMLWWLMEQLLASRKLQILLEEFPP